MNPAPQPSRSSDAALLEVAVLHPRDAEAATSGGADRLLLLAEPATGGRSVELGQVSAVLRETDLPVRVMLGRGSLEAGAEDFAWLVEHAASCVELGAHGFSFGFLDRDLEIDRPTCAELAREIGGLPWTFHRGFDAALEADRAWRDVLTLPALDGVASGGSTRGFATGGDELLSRARTDPRVAQLLVASGGLTTEEVPWLVRAGVRQFGLTDEVRPDRSWDKAHVGVDYVRSWRMLLDDALDRAMGTPVD